MNITGKTIAKVTKMKKPEFDDAGWIKLDFTDGTICIIMAGYHENYTGSSECEYPTWIEITEDEEGLVPATTE